MGLLDFFSGKKKAVDQDTLVEAGVCPNCWGKQEWDGKFKDYAADRTKDILNKDASSQQAFIQKFVTDNITGIRLKKDGDKSVCPACNTGYKHVSTHTN